MSLKLKRNVACEAQLRGIKVPARGGEEGRLLVGLPFGYSSECMHTESFS